MNRRLESGLHDEGLLILSHPGYTLARAQIRNGMAAGDSLAVYTRSARVCAIPGQVRLPRNGTKGCVLCSH